VRVILREGHVSRYCMVSMLPDVTNVTVKSHGTCDAASADKIVAQPGTITGSIGVAFGKFNASQALKDQGINVDTVAVGRNATAQSLFHDFTKEQRRQVNVLMDRCDTYHQGHARPAMSVCSLGKLCRLIVILEEHKYIGSLCLCLACLWGDESHQLQCSSAAVV